MISELEAPLVACTVSEVEVDRGTILFVLSVEVLV